MNASCVYGGSGRVEWGTAKSLTASRVERWAVVDVETTGFSRYDRVVEVGIVSMDGAGGVVDEYVTLVDPDRDVGATHVHGITATMTRNAPRFEEIAGTVAGLLDGAVLVAHNATFDLRLLSQEFDRLGVSIDGVRPVCTMQLGTATLNCGGKLTDLCEVLGIPLEYCHSALHDARATAEVLRRVAERRPIEIAAESIMVAQWSEMLESSPRTVRRERFIALSDEEAPYLTRLTRRLPSRPHQFTVETYLRVLDDALVDLVFHPDERALLDEVAEIAGLAPRERAQAHGEYFDELIRAAERDGVVTDDEYEVLRRVAVLLEQDIDALDRRVARYRPMPEGDEPVLAPGSTVCFTGDAGTDADGRPLTRELLEEMAEAAGLIPQASFTKRDCDLLVAADPATRSGKAKKAHKWGIPVVSVDDFLSFAHHDPHGGRREEMP